MDNVVEVDRQTAVTLAEEEAAVRNSSTAGRFFAVHRTTWAKVVALGLNAAVTYLVLVRGSGRSNRTSTWSVHAIERYTALSRGRAHQAIKTLCDAGNVRCLRGGTRPKYEIVIDPELQPARNATLTTEELRTLDRALLGEVSPADEDSVGRLIDAGRLVRRKDEHFDIPDVFERSAWIWLPNEIVTTAGSETPPVELLRQTQDIVNLALFTELYHIQNLREDCGLGRAVIHRLSERRILQKSGLYTVWGFRLAHAMSTWLKPTDVLCSMDASLQGAEAIQGYLDRMDILVRLGLLEWMPHLFDGPDVGAEIIHPYSLVDGPSLEHKMGPWAHAAGRAMLNAHQRARVDTSGLYTAPVPRHVAKVQLIDVARLRYRPHTRLTAAWRAEIEAKAAAICSKYRELAFQHAEREAVRPGLQDQSRINA